MIAHPPCTYLSNAGNMHLKQPGRKEKRKEAFNFFMMLYNAPIDKICVENPVGCVNSYFRKPDQIIHPYYFGEPHLKRTCLWLKNLPKLDYSKTIIEKPAPLSIGKKGKSIGKCYYYVDSLIYCKDPVERSRLRSKTFQSIANAMVDQWGILI